MIKFFRKILIEFRKWNNFRRSFISLRFRKGLPRLIVHEKYEKLIKWTLRILVIIGILSSILTLPFWWMSLIFAFILFGLEQFLEKTIFQYTSIFIQPLPNFTYDPQRWLGMAFAFPVQSEKERLLNVVGCLFDDEDYAKKFFNLLRAWNYMNKIDYERNICLSFIIENDENYSVYLYPNLERDIVKQAFKEIEEERKFEKYGKEHQQLVVQIIFCKQFSYGPDSQLKKFIETQQKEKPFWLMPFIKTQDGRFKILENIDPILIFHFKVKKRDELTKKEIEYQHGKSVMGI